MIPRAVLAAGFILAGHRIPLVAPQGIFKPRVLPDVPLSITTAPNGPYSDKDTFGPDGLRYSYRATSPDHADNEGLRLAMRRQVPLVFLYGIMRGRYVAIFPVFIVGDDPRAQIFTVAVEDRAYLGTLVPGAKADAREATGEIRREYLTVVTRRRLHQAAFRERVLDAYRNQCSLCSLRHRELLDAAHIIEDSDPDGHPHLRNGLALCKLHHAAFDSFFLGLRPDLVIEVRPDILRESDGPILLHGLQQMHKKRIQVPRSALDRPGADLLERRYQRFREEADAA